jgi:hypothetical protein
VAPFIGDSVDEFQEHVTELVSTSDWDLVAADDYISAAVKLDATSAAQDDIARVAREMQLSAVVYGKLIKKSKRRATLQIIVRDESGEIIDTLQLRVRRGALSKKGVALMERRVLAALDGLMPEPAPDAEPPPAAEPPAQQPAQQIASETAKPEAKKPEPKKPEPKKPEPKVVAAKKPEPKKPAAKKQPEIDPDSTHGNDLDLDVDDSGQVKDDEWPDDLK